MGVDREDVSLHDVPDAGLIGGQQHPPHRDHPQQHPVLGDIAGVDGLLVDAHAADAGKGLLHRGVWMEKDELRGHDGAGGVLGIVQQLVDLAAGGGVGVAQDPGDHVGRHVLDDVHRVIQVQLVQHLPQLPVAEGPDQLLLVLGVLQVGEHLRRRVLGQQAEDQDLLLHVQLVQELGDVHLVHLGQQLLHAAELPLFHQLQQQVQVIVFVHALFPPFVHRLEQFGTQKGHKGDGHLENGRLGGAPLSAPAVFQMHFDPVAAHERGGGFPSPDLFRYRRRGGTAAGPCSAPPPVRDSGRPDPDGDFGLPCVPTSSPGICSGGSPFCLYGSPSAPGGDLYLSLSIAFPSAFFQVKSLLIRPPPGFLPPKSPPCRS